MELRSRQVAPELQLLVSQLSSSLELPLRRLGLELRRLELELRRLRLEPCSAGDVGKLLRLVTEPFRLDRDPCRLETEPFVEVEPCRVGEERLDGQRGGSSSSWSHPENTGQEAVEEQEPRSCRPDAVLGHGCLFNVDTVPLTVTPLPVFDEPFCIFCVHEKLDHDELGWPDFDGPPSHRSPLHAITSRDERTNSYSFSNAVPDKHVYMDIWWKKG